MSFAAPRLGVVSDYVAEDCNLQIAIRRELRLQAIPLAARMQRRLCGIAQLV